MRQIVFPEPEHERVIEIMERAQKELEASGYTVEFTKTFQAEELLPSYSNAYFNMKLTAVKRFGDKAMRDW